MKKRILLLLLLTTALAWAQRGLAGSYEGENGNRHHRLVLSNNRQAELTTTFSYGKAPIVQTGTWKLSDRLLTVDLSRKNNAPNYERLVFQVDQGELVATQYNVKNWGPNGLVLTRSDFADDRTSSGRAPEIQSVLVSPARALKVGETLTVQVTGTPGCQASFDILGAAQDVVMNEVGNGRYQGQLQLTSDMTASDAVLVARLSRNGREAQKEASRTVTIEGSGMPSTGQLELLPARDTQAYSYRPVIGVTFPGPVARGSYRLWLDGAEVTGYAQVTDSSLRYTPRGDLTQGRHTARLLGPGVDEQWDFTVTGSSVTPAPADGSQSAGSRPRIEAHFQQPVQTGSVRLWLDNSEVTGTTRMTNYDAVYIPNFDLQPGSHRARVTARGSAGELVDYSWGFSVGGNANQPGPMFVQVSSPANYARVPANFIMTGTATPSMIVEIEGVVTQALIPGVVGVKTEKVKYSLYADANGNWSMPIVFPGTNGSAMDLTLTARDSYGTVSNPIKLRYVLQK